jgi:hypothetical protein
MMRMTRKEMAVAAVKEAVDQLRRDDSDEPLGVIIIVSYPDEAVSAISGPAENLAPLRQAADEATKHLVPTSEHGSN